MDKEEQTTDETIEVVDTDMTDNQSVEEQNAGTKATSEVDTESTTVPSATDTQLHERNDSSQTTPEPSEATTAESPPPGGEPATPYLDVLENRLTAMNQHLVALQNLFESQIARNQNQKQMFDRIYKEVDDYRKDAVFNRMEKPVIHNLIRLYDNVVSVEEQLKGIIELYESFGSQIGDINETLELMETWFGSYSDRERRKFINSNEELAAKLEKLKDKPRLPQANTELKEKLQQFQMNLENVVRFELEEVLYRMDVTPYEEQSDEGQLKELDRKLHKTIKTVPTDNPDLDQLVKETHRTGFYWREKVFRPEEVTIFRYTPPVGGSEETVTENPTDEKGDETNG